MSQLLARRPSAAAILLVAAIALAFLAGAAALRGTEYDENYTVFLAAGTARPAWPDTVFRAGDVRHVFSGASTASGIAGDLRHWDVHPPLYFWAAAAWRALAGTSLYVTRLLSVIFSVAALLVVAGIAVLAEVPPVGAMLLTLGCYGYAYTGHIARGFALAQLLALLGVLALLHAERRGRPATAFAAGLLLGLAGLTNYLAAFVAGASLLWLLLRQPRRVTLWLAAGIGYALVLPAELWFFLAQRGSRVGQFPPFRLLPSLARLAQYSAANVFGGLPLYVSGTARVLLGGVLALLLAGLVALIVARYRRLGAPGARLLLAMAAAAPPFGLVLLGLAFDNTPIELRYIAFATPFLGLLAAGAFASLPARAGRLLCVAMLAVQAAALAGMVVRPETMQPQRQTATEAAALAIPGSIVVLPYGNDGVGVVAAFVNEAPDQMQLLVVGKDTPPDEIARRVAPFSRVVLALLGLDADSRATLPRMQAAVGDRRCWKPAAATPRVAAFDKAC